MSILSPKKSKEQETIERGRSLQLQPIAARRDEAWEFYRGNHYASVNEKNRLQYQATTTTSTGAGKPRWKARQVRNLIFDVTLHEVSSFTQRVPGYEIDASTTDPEDIGAARLSEKVSLYGYYQWHLRRTRRDAILHAVVAGEAFAWPYFDNTIGPFVDDGQGAVGLGDVCVRIYGANECYWEPGLRFENSPWHAVEQARSVDSVTSTPGYTGPEKLTPDASSNALSARGRGRSGKPKLVLVTDYLELPSSTNPQGLWVTLANGQRIFPDRPYPGKGDAPILRKLSYAPDPDSDRDLGLVTQLLDAQRTYNDTNNKCIELKNLYLVPRGFVTPGLLKKQRITDEPGKWWEVPQPEQNVKFMDPPPPQLMQQLMSLSDRAEGDIDRIAAQGPRDASQIESGKEAQVLAGTAASRRDMFTADLADFDANVMHDCLVLVNEHYSDPRLLQIRGRFGPEPLPDFRGADLRSQVDVRVPTDSIEPHTKESVEQKIQMIAQFFPGAFSPEELLEAQATGNASSLIESFELAKSRANTVIQKIRDGSYLAGEVPMRPVMGGENAGPQIDPATGRPTPQVGPDGNPVVLPGPTDPMTGQPGPPEVQYVQATEVPEWMPRPFDNIPVQKKQFESWMQTSDWDSLPNPLKEIANQCYQALLDLEAKKAQRDAQMQSAMAQNLGMANAAAPQGAKPMPSLPNLQGPPAQQGGSAPENTPA